MNPMTALLQNVAYNLASGDVLLTVELRVQDRPTQVQVVTTNRQLAEVAGFPDWGDDACRKFASSVLGVPVS